jgi:hypothetical protein
VDGAGDQLLAGTRFAQNQHRLGGGRVSGDAVANHRHGLTVAEQPTGGDRVTTVGCGRHPTGEDRPIYHQRDDTIRGHVFCSFLALVLRQELQRHLAAKGWRLEWEHIVHDLDALHETTVTLEERRYVVRSQAKRTVGKVFQACGVALPPALRSLPAAESPPPG